MKSLNEFVKLFAEQFDDIDVNDIKATTEYKKLDEWTSLMALSIIAMVDEEFGITIKGEDIRNSISIEDLYNVVKSKL